MRAVVDIDEDARGRACLIVTELPYQVNPDNLAAEDRRAGPGRPGQRHRRRAGREQRPHRPAADHRAEAGRGGQGRAEQPVQAHPAAGHVRRQHARPGRRRAPHAAAGPDDPVLGRAPDRGHRPAHPVPAPPGAGAGAHRQRAAQGDRPDRRGHRADPRQRVRERRHAGPDGPAGDRRGAGPGHPRHAAAQARRPRAPGAHRRVRGADGEDRRLRGDPGLARAAAPDRQR